jgi:hypothetical protein
VEQRAEWLAPERALRLNNEKLNSWSCGRPRPRQRREYESELTLIAKIGKASLERRPDYG